MQLTQAIQSLRDGYAAVTSSSGGYVHRQDYENNAANAAKFPAGVVEAFDVVFVENPNFPNAGEYRYFCQTRESASGARTTHIVSITGSAPELEARLLDIMTYADWQLVPVTSLEEATTYATARW